MTRDLLTRLREANPARSADTATLLDAGDRDAELRRIMEESPVAPAVRRPKPRLRVAMVAAGATCLALALVFSGRTGERGHTSQAIAARAYRAVSAPKGIYHFVSIARLSVPRDYVASGGGLTGPLFYRPYAYWSRTSRNGHGPSLYLSINRDHYEEDWLTLDNRRSRARTFSLVSGRRGRMLHEVTSDSLHDWSYVPRTNLLTTTTFSTPTRPAFPDPVTAFRQAYKAHSVRLVGAATVAGHAAWQLEDRRSAATVTTWFVDRGSYLPIEVRHREALQAGTRPIGTIETRIRFLTFELLPLNSHTERLVARTRRPGVRVLRECGPGYRCTPAQSKRWRASLRHREA
jgi:hypothetical protein